MRIYSDWNCRLLPMMSDLITNPVDTVRSLQLLNEKFGLSHFCMMLEFDCNHESVASFIIRRDKAFEALTDQLPKNIRITPGASVLVSDGLSSETGLKKLLLPGTNLLPVRLPYFSGNETAKELNRLLYHLPYRILFLSFDSYLNFYPKDDIQRWTELPNTAYQWNYSALEVPLARDLLKKLLSRNSTVLFGTGLRSYEKACYYEMDHYVDLASKYFSDYEIDQMFFPKKSSIR